ncbi:MAG TPA: polyhydroxyalkanoate synthesis regulator DNA-binding domain-containing protein [Candidatus Angelobacter sp.]|jgi:polyhydroxyalkanoate synthesis repressor PhaR|nr:polyhydroxyalkanoate synthesis regulator DNA-binding domain-containing protein [Candidatus Angelobacter sp.]
MPAGTIVIRKYPNRRLYDTSASSYINLEDIAVFVREGKGVQVIDAQTGEDITRVTLTQIIMDDAKQQPTGLPLELLRQLIVSSDRMGREFIMWYLKSAYDAYQSVQSKLHTGLNEVQAAAVSPINAVKNFLQNQVPAAPTQPTQPGATRELQQLRQRVAELEARVAKPAKRKAPAKQAAPAKRKAAKKSPRHK